MLSLYLLRHGEAEPGAYQKKDISRSLTDFGKDKLLKLASTLKRRKIRFDHVLVSSAQRTLETKSVLESVMGGFSSKTDPSIYEADPRSLILTIGAQADTHKSILLIGHNPGISSVAAYFSGETFLNLAPGMMAILYFDMQDWQTVTAESGILMEILG